ncbi:hypothetical protein [Flagellimonas pacifica]|uniref:DUF423 domain-containing protein n=1 Tax=Flagellimonas pacifica TaxID=1247520 RepID=A0A285MHC5_9FLAO|nr:hypothetical protein [Allomuricauda parva]SNY94891.1 hypothetical protein SAMN06265377_0552 [Allomuricauda parva]
MKTKISIKLAGFMNLFGALVHTFLGQTTLVNPLMDSDLNAQAKIEWLGVWHIVTVILFATSYVYLNEGFKSKTPPKYTLIKQISWLYVLFSLIFIIVSIWQQILAPQWILLLPVGLFGFFGVSVAKKGTN